MIEVIHYHQPETLGFTGGWETDKEVEGFIFPFVKHLYLKEMASVKLTSLFSNFPEVQSFEVDDAREGFTEENFRLMLEKMTLYQGLQRILID